jgi:hypothetical protein
LKVYHLQSQSGGSQFLRPATVEDGAILEALAGMPVKHDWPTPTIRLFRESDFFDGTVPVDFPLLIPGVPVFSPQAVAALRDVLDMHGEVLPLACEDCDGRGYVAFNVTTVIDALDVPRSAVKFFRDGARVMHVTRYDFIPERLAGVAIFKLPQFVKGRVYVTDAFVQLVQDHGLTGFKFTPLWSTATP